MHKNKVLLFAQNGIGGAERMTIFIGKNLEKSQYDICYCLITKSTGSLLNDFIPSGNRIRNISSKNIVFLLLSMWWVLLVEKPQYVFSSVINISNKLLLLKPLFKKIKFIIRCDNYMYTYTEKQRNMIRKLYPRADAIIAQTEEMGNELIECADIPYDIIKVLHNPIDKDLIDQKTCNTNSPYPNNGKRHIVAVGRFAHQKGFDLLVEAFINLNKKRNDIELYIIGETRVENGNVAECVKRKSEEANVSNLVHLCGYKSNPYPYIKYADSFVLSSRWEGLPNVLIEALYLGTPVAAFKCIPIVERIVCEGLDGFLAEKEDVNSLAVAMNESLELGRVVSSYKSSDIKDFIKVFV